MPCFVHQVTFAVTYSMSMPIYDPAAPAPTPHAQPRPPFLGHFFHPRPCPLSFHCLTSSSIPSIACLRASSRPFCVRSHNLPLTRCPTPVPLTRIPSSSVRFCTVPDSFGDQGSSVRQLCFVASEIRSACFRRLYTGGRHRPVSGFLCGRNGFGRSENSGAGDCDGVCGCCEIDDEVEVNVLGPAVLIIGGWRRKKFWSWRGRERAIWTWDLMEAMLACEVLVHAPTTRVDCQSGPVYGWRMSSGTEQVF